MEMIVSFTRRALLLSSCDRIFFDRHFIAGVCANVVMNNQRISGYNANFVYTYLIKIVTVLIAFKSQ